MPYSVEEHEGHVEVEVAVPPHLPEVSLLCLSDTHDQQADMPNPLPQADIIVHAGDFTCRGSREEITAFQEWTDRLLQEGVARHVVFVCGNHEISLELKAKHAAVRRQQEEMKRALIERENVHYLEDTACEVEGLRFHGSPWTTKFGRDWAFQRVDTEDEEHGLGGKFSAIPEGIDVLVTHQPPLGQGDMCDSKRTGSRVLRERVKDTSPLVHVFGHIHTGHGVSSSEGDRTLFVNAAICDEDYQPIQKPILIRLVHQPQDGQ